MFNTLKHHLDKSKIEYAVLDENKAIGFPTRTEKGSFNCLAIIDDNLDRFVFYTDLNVVIPANRRTAMCEMLTRINCGLILGNFEMDMEEGVIRFKTSIDVEGGKLIDKFIENMISTNLSVVDAYFHAILETISASLSVKDILFKYEQNLINE
jgi:hypothetical protein